MDRSVANACRQAAMSRRFGLARGSLLRAAEPRTTKRAPWRKSVAWRRLSLSQQYYLAVGVLRELVCFVCVLERALVADSLRRHESGFERGGHFREHLRALRGRQVGSVDADQRMIFAIEPLEIEGDFAPARSRDDGHSAAAPQACIEIVEDRCAHGVERDVAALDR